MPKIRAAARLAALPLALLAVFLVYARSLDGRFVYDDHHFVERNPALVSLSSPGRFFSDPSTQSDNAGLNSDVYRPLATLSYALDYAAAGLTPGYFRAVNVLLHGANALLLFLLAGQLGLEAPYAALAAAFFALFPPSVEAVAWVSGRSGVLSCSFILLSLIWFVKYSGGGRKRFLVLSALAGAAALFTREISVVLPLLVLSYLLVFGATRRRLLDAALSLGLPAALFVLLRFELLGKLQQTPPPALSVLGLASLPLLIFAKYLDVLVWPFHMLVNYSDLMELRLRALGFYLPFALLAFLLYCALVWALLRRGRRTEAWGLLWFFIALLPVLNIVSIATFMAERLLYLPVAGAALALAAAGSRLGGSVRARTAFFAACAALLALFAVNIQYRLPVWHDDVSLWSYDARQNPWDFLTRMKLSDALKKAGDPEGAAAALRDALGRASSAWQRAMAYNEMGVLLAMDGKVAEAERFFRTSVRLDPGDPVALYNLARALAERGDNGSSREYLRLCLQRDAGYEPALKLLDSLQAPARAGKGES